MAPNTLAPAKRAAKPETLAPGHSLPPITVVATSMQAASADSLSPGHITPDDHTGFAGASTCDGHHRNETQPAAAVASLGPDHCYLDAHSNRVRANYAMLLIFADAVDDLERVRIATDNRLRSLRDVKGLAESREYQRMEAVSEALADLEHQAILDLQRAMRQHPLGPWVKRTVGIGEKQAARLLAAISDPADRPNPAKLWQYCGHGDPARSHCRKGRPVEHSPVAKMRTRLIAESCIKQAHSPYRGVYDRERAKWADRDTSDGHKHNHALRVVGKALLLDLWREAKEIA